MRLIYLALGWIVGVLYAASDPLILPIIWAFVAGVSLLMAILLRRFSFLIISAAALGVLRFDSLPRTTDVIRFNETGYVVVEGVISAEPDQRDTNIQLRIRVDNVWQDGETQDSSGIVLAFAPRTFAGNYGDRVRARGELETPSESDRFSYADYLARAEIYSIMPRASLSVIESARSGDFRSALIELKTWAEASITRSLPEPQASLLTGILLGDDHGLSPDVKDAFAETGTAHVIAISGFNMVILGGFVSQLLRQLRVKPLPAALISIVVIVLYTIFVGASAAVVRAAFMTSLSFFGAALRRKSYTPTSLAFAALVLTIIDPRALWDVGFQLSFFAVLGLALFARPLTDFYDRVFGNLPKPLKPVSGLLRESLTVGVAAIVFTLPLSALYFGRLSPALLIVNALIVPAQPALMLLGGFALLTSALIPALAQLLFWADWLLLSWTISVVRLFAQLLDVAIYPSAQIIAAGFASVILVALIRAARPTWMEKLMTGSRLRLIMVVLIGISAAIFALAFILWRSRPDGLLHVWFFDLGSTTTLLQTPSGAQILIDGGSYPSRLLTALGDRMPFNDQSIEIQFITALDDALVAALPVAYERYQAGQIIVNGSLTLDALNAALDRFPQTQALSGQIIQTGDGVGVEVEHAAETQETSASSETDDALVLRVTYGNMSLLLTGTLSVDGQEALLSSGGLLPVTILQMPRGGRKDSLAGGFVETLVPQIVVFQFDAVSSRTTPDPETLVRFGESPLYRSDTNGTIHLITDGQTVRVEVERASPS